MRGDVIVVPQERDQPFEEGEAAEDHHDNAREPDPSRHAARVHSCLPWLSRCGSGIRLRRDFAERLLHPCCHALRAGPGSVPQEVDEQPEQREHQDQRRSTGPCRRRRDPVAAELRMATSAQMAIQAIRPMVAMSTGDGKPTSLRQESRIVAMPGQILAGGGSAPDGSALDGLRPRAGRQAAPEDLLRADRERRFARVQIYSQSSTRPSDDRAEASHIRPLRAPTANGHPRTGPHEPGHRLRRRREPPRTCSRCGGCMASIG